MVKLILLGGGKIGSAITAMLASTGDYQLTVADRDGESEAQAAALLAWSSAAGEIRWEAEPAGPLDRYAS